MELKVNVTLEEIVSTMCPRCRHKLSEMLKKRAREQITDTMLKEAGL